MREPREHHLKTDSPVFWKVVQGIKRCDLRLNDRDFREGDILHLQETQHRGEEMKPQHNGGFPGRNLPGKPLIYTGNEITAVVTDVLEGYGLLPRHAALSIEVVEVKLAQVTGENFADNQILQHAALLLDREAVSLHECHTINGEWDAQSIINGAQAEYNDLVETAKQLRYMRPAQEEVPSAEPKSFGLVSTFSDPPVFSCPLLLVPVFLALAAAKQAQDALVCLGAVVVLLICLYGAFNFESIGKRGRGNAS